MVAFSPAVKWRHFSVSSRELGFSEGPRNGQIPPTHARALYALLVPSPPPGDGAPRDPISAIGPHRREWWRCGCTR